MRAHLVVWRPAPGRWAVTVCVKATFDLSADHPALVRDQVGPSIDRYWNDDPTASLWVASDYAPYKPKVDVSLVGHAYSPVRSAPSHLVARLAVGDRTKRVHVHGDRRVQRRGGALLNVQQPITAVPLRYERGARDAANPIGFDTEAPPDELPVGDDLDDTTLPLGRPASPNLEADRSGSPCFGPWPLEWRARAIGASPAAHAWAARFSPAWQSESKALVVHEPAPGDFDFALFNAAPPELQLASVSGGEPIVIDNMHRLRSSIVTAVPSAAPRVVRGATELPVRCDTIWIDADRQRLVAAWRATVHVEDVASERFMVVSEDPRVASVQAATGGDDDTITLPLGDHAQDPLETTMDSDPLSVGRAPLPFRATGPHAARVVPPPAMVHVAPVDGAAILRPATVGASTASRSPAPIASLSITRYGILVAQLEARPAEREAVLDGYDLNEATYTELVARFERELAEDKGQGGLLQRAFDLAYSTARRRPGDELALKEYAMLTVANERGEAEAALATLGLRPTEGMRIQQVWRRRLTLDPALRAELDRAIAIQKKNLGT